MKLTTRFLVLPLLSLVILGLPHPALAKGRHPPAKKAKPAPVSTEEHLNEMKKAANETLDGLEKGIKEAAGAAKDGANKGLEALDEAIHDDLK